MSSPPIVAHPPGVPCQRKRPPESDTQDHPPAKTVAGWDLTDSGIVEAMSVPTSAPVVSGGADATERSPPVCEGELCGVSPYFFPSRLSSKVCCGLVLARTVHWIVCG